MENSKIKKKPPLSRSKKIKGNSLKLLQYQRSPKIDTVSIFISIQHNNFLHHHIDIFKLLITEIFDSNTKITQ